MNGNENAIENENQAHIVSSTKLAHFINRAARLFAPQASGRRFSARKGVAGQSLLELALSLPFLITLLLALLEVGFLIRSHLTILYATREGARAEAAAGNTEPQYFPYSADQPYIYNDYDGDTVMVNNVNTALQNERYNVLYMSTYKADSTTGDPCYHTGTWATDNGANGCSMNSPTTNTTNYTVWPVYGLASGSTNVLFQEVFQREPAPNYGFSRLLMDGQAGTQACPNQAPYKGMCGSNRNNGANQTWKNPTYNPWYPGLRCNIDPSQATLVKGGQATGNYYNGDLSVANSGLQTTRDWIGVRIDYKHSWFTAWFPGSPLVLSDRSVYNLEPGLSNNGLVQTDCSNSPHP
jgi:Flp pilus assembly protein TadG